VKFDVVMFFLFFGAASSASAASAFICFAMVGEINRKRDDGSQISYFRSSWTKIWREYGLLYPKGRYRRALAVALILWGIFSLISVILLFGVLPKYGLPSRRGAQISLLRR